MTGTTIRPATDGELTLVRDSWTKGASRGELGRMFGSRMVKMGRRDRGMERQAFAAAHRQWVDTVLEDENTTVEVIVATGEPDEALGWVCYDVVGQAVHWIWVRGPARRLGLGTALLGRVVHRVREATGRAPMALAYTHMTPDGARLLEARRQDRASSGTAVPKLAVEGAKA